MRKIICSVCGIVVETNAPNVKRCPECRDMYRLNYHKTYHKDHYQRIGYSGWGERNSNWKHGLGRLVNGGNRLIKLERRYCEICRTDLIDATRYYWCIHHKDQNRKNNSIDNLQLLCKKCHQTLHKNL